MNSIIFQVTIGSPHLTLASRSGKLQRRTALFAATIIKITDTLAAENPTSQQ
jgi:hypothetical protein